MQKKIYSKLRLSAAKMICGSRHRKTRAHNSQLAIKSSFLCRKRERESEQMKILALKIFVVLSFTTSNCLNAYMHCVTSPATLRLLSLFICFFFTLLYFCFFKDLVGLSRLDSTPLESNRIDRNQLVTNYVN